MPAPTLPMVRFAGLLYVVIIVFGISSEVLLRGPLVASGSAAGVAAAIAANPVPLRLSIAADAVMAISDTALAVLLFLILRAYGPGLALAAMVFRLMQGAVIAASLMVLFAALTPGSPTTLLPSSRCTVSAMTLGLRSSESTRC